MNEEAFVSTLGIVFAVIAVFAILACAFNLFFGKSKKGPNKFTSDTFKKNKFDNFVGVEIECLGKRGEGEVSNSKLKEYNFTEGTDGSIHEEKGYREGYEYRSKPANGDKLYEMIDGISKELIEHKYKVNKSCGLHVHIETKPDVELLKKMYCFYSKFEGLFFAMLPISRQETQYCEKFNKLDKYSYEDVLDVKDLRGFKKLFYEKTGFYPTKIHGNKKRYCWINFHSIFYRGTLEVRAHSGTINAEKIKNWIQMHLVIRDYLNKNSLEDLIKMKTSKKKFLSLFPKDLQKYINKRWEVFPEVAEENFKEYS